MPISSETEDAIRSVCDSVLCPLCGKFNDHNKYESLMSCGHHLCSNCVRSFVLKSDNKCPKCYQLNNKNDIKTDQFMTDLRKMTSKLGQLIDKNTNKKNQLKTIESESKQLPKSESKCAPKTQKGLIIESLKACISSCSKTKEKKSSEELSRIENSSKKSLKLLPQTKAQIMVQLSGDLDPNKESVPDSYDSNLRFTQDSHNLNKDNDLMGKVSQIVDDLQSNSSNSQINTNKSDSNEKYTDLAINKNTTEGKSNAGFEQNCESNDLKKYETNIAKKTHLGNKQKQNVLKSSAVVKSNELNDKKKERQETNEKSIQVELMTFKPKLSKEKLIQVSIEEEKPETDDKEIQVMIKSSDFSVQHKTQTIDVYSQTTESQVFSDGQQTNSCNANNCCLHKNLSKIIELNLCPTLNALLNGLLTHSNDVNNHNQTRAVFANSVQENESIVTKNAVSSEKIANNLEKLTETNDSINESYELSSKSVPIKPSKRQSNKQNNTKNTAKRSAVQMKAKSKKIKTEETVAKPSVSDDSTSHLDLKDNKESNTELIEDKMPETTLNHKSNRTNAGKKMSQKTHVKTSSTSSEDEEDLHLISEKNSFEKTRNTRKLTPNQKKRKLIDCNTDKMDSDDQMQTKTNPRKQRKPVKRLPPKVKEIKNIDEEEEDKICNNSKKNVSSLKRSSRTVSNIPNEDKFKRPTSPTPSISSIASSSSTSSRLRTSSTERPQMKRFCILNSGLDDSHKKKIINVGKELNAEVVSDWSDRVTHLVIGLVKDRNKKERICQRNIKFMKALMANKWIVSFDWITDSLRSNRFVDESNYEIKGVKNAVESNAPNKSRTSGLKLFKDRMVCFKGKFSRLACDIEEIKQLVTIGGGLLIDSEKEFKPINANIKLISVSEAIGLPNTQNGIKYMSVNTFLDMISNFEDF